MGYTYQLNCSHVFLPPQKFLEARSSSRKAIVEIHNNVDGRVYHGMERSHSTWSDNHKHHTEFPRLIIFISMVRSSAQSFLKGFKKTILSSRLACRMSLLQNTSAMLPPPFSINHWQLKVMYLPGAYATPHHQVQGMKEWWKMCRKVIWPCFFLNTKKI